MPALRQAEGLCVEDPVAAHLNNVPHVQAGTLILAPEAELVLREALIGCVEDMECFLCEGLHREVSVMADLVPRPLYAVDSLPLGSAETAFGVAIIILTEENDVGGDLMGHGGRAGWFPVWLETASAAGATRPRKVNRQEYGILKWNLTTLGPPPRRRRSTQQNARRPPRRPTGAS